MKNILLTLVLSSFIFANSIVAQNSPNIVFLIGDDISWNDFGCYGNDVVKTPNIDKLANDGMMFTNAFLTASSCSPSRISILTGRYPHCNGAAELHSPLPADQLTFVGELQKAGYYTAQAGKFHFGPEARKVFDRYTDDKKSKNGDGGEDNWVKWLQERPKSKSFFMWFASHDAHRVWGADKFMQPHNPEDIIVPPYLVDDLETKKDLASYYNEIQRLDFYVGEVRKELENQGVSENTIIVVCADNGRPFPRCKTRVYDSGMQTPFIAYWPKGIKKPGSVCNSLVSIIDVAPTFLELAGSKIAPNFQGRSFAKLFEKPKDEFRKFVFSEHNWHDFEAHERMVRSKDFLYVLNSRPNLELGGPADSKNSLTQASLNKARENGILTFAQADNFATPRPVEELFNLNIDPLQLNNLASGEAYQHTLKELRNILKIWRDETGDNIPENITPNQFDPISGKKLGEIQRGEMPGVNSGGTKVLNGGLGF